jgi:hypothetical protein
MRFAFLEGGVAWGCSLLADLISHWEKRNATAIQELNPANLDREGLAKLFGRYGGDQLSSRFAEFESWYSQGMGHAVPDNVDDYAPAMITKKEDIRDLFVPKFFFGCESDDPTVTYAFARANPFGAKLGAVLSSDISHFDVPDMTEVLQEAWELVEERGLSEEDFQAFTFGNAVKLWTSVNAGFFDGTVVEGAVRSLVNAETGRTAAMTAGKK